ncbi:MAG: hypothetical protein Q4C91_16015 [Eubacteriales bacterium]|nr:hypothetical protein [Eubacteriales bacterium]
MSKWEASGREYMFKEVKEPEEKEIETIVSGISGIKIAIGGN